MTETPSLSEVTDELDDIKKVAAAVKEMSPDRPSSSLIPTSVRRFVGTTNSSSLAVSASSTVDDIEMILEDDESLGNGEGVYFSTAAQLAAEELNSLLIDLADQMESENAPDDLINSVDSQRKSFEELLDRIPDQSKVEKDPTASAMEEMTETIDEFDEYVDDSDLKTEEDYDVETELKALKNSTDSNQD